MVFGRRKGTKALDLQRQKKRKHHIVPWIESPLDGADEEELVFHQRHEANTVELFFDLFFVANLATFTAYHSVTDRSSLMAYIGFFAILWATWFQITLHDCRFARDSVYERACKTIQFVAFVGFALVGSKFEPSSKKIGNNTNFRILCYTLVLSRALFAIQYVVVLIFTAKKGYKKLYFPLILNIATYSAAALAFGAMTPAFSKDQSFHPAVYSVWWVVMFTESAATIAISSCWRMLSFKKTHIVERMGLLTLIVIGEGAIGVTKTISRLMGKYGLDAEASGLILCIILILVFLWMVYFDNHPHGHYGTIRQQLWSVLHFPLHLAIVGLVEGSQQVALARYVMRETDKLNQKIYKACMIQNLDGYDLTAVLAEALDYYQLDKKAETEAYIPHLIDALYSIGNDTGICSPAHTDPSLFEPGLYPQSLVNILYDMIGGIYASLGMKLPLDKDQTQVAISSWKIVYQYYWGSMLILLLVLILHLILIRKNKADVFDWVSILTRLVLFTLSIVLLALSTNIDILFTYLGSPAVLPTAVIMLLIIIFFDRISAVFSNWRLRKSGATPADDHEHGHEHGAYNHDHQKEASKNETGVAISQVNSFTTGTEYNPMPTVSSAIPMTSMTTYSSASPPAPYTPLKGGQYMPVNNAQYVH